MAREGFSSCLRGHTSVLAVCGISKFSYEYLERFPCVDIADISGSSSGSGNTVRTQTS